MGIGKVDKPVRFQAIFAGDMMKVSVVIRSYNEEKHIGKLLSGIAEQTVGDVEIILVDSGSTDATVSIASMFGAKVLTIDRQQFTFGRSLNIGCQAAGGEFIVLASAHVYPVYRDWIEHLLIPFKDPRTSLVYGKQRGDETTKFSENQIFRKWFPDKSNVQQAHPFCNNANVAIRKSSWRQMPYNELLTGLEDLDWAKRAVQIGGRIVYSDKAEVVHVHDETWPNVYNRYRREAIAMKAIYPEERFSLLDFIRLFFVNSFSDCRDSITEKVFWENIPGIFAFRFMQFWGTYRGYMQRTGISSQLRKKFYYPNRLKHPNSQRVEPEPDRLIKYNSNSMAKEDEASYCCSGTDSS